MYNNIKALCNFNINAYTLMSVLKMIGKFSDSGHKC